VLTRHPIKERRGHTNKNMLFCIPTLDGHLFLDLFNDALSTSGYK